MLNAVCRLQPGSGGHQTGIYTSGSLSHRVNQWLTLLVQQTQHFTAASLKLFSSFLTELGSLGVGVGLTGLCRRLAAPDGTGTLGSGALTFGSLHHPAFCGQIQRKHMNMNKAFRQKLNFWSLRFTPTYLHQYLTFYCANCRQVTRTYFAFLTPGATFLAVFAPGHHESKKPLWII